MNKKTTGIIIAIVVLLILAGGAWALHSHQKAISQEEAIPTTKQQQQISTQKKSLFDFLSMTGSLKCTFSNKAKSSSGTVYVSNGKMRGDFQSENDGKTVQSHMVNDKSYFYTWIDGQKDGYKMSLATLKDTMDQSKNDISSSHGQTPSQAVDFHQQTNYSCAPSAVNASLFTVPQDITFTDFSAMMQNLKGGTSTKPEIPNTMHGSQAVCAQCNQAPAGSARNQCLSALKCQ